MILACSLVVGVAVLNLALIRLAGLLWDQITVQRDSIGMARSIGVFLGLVIAQGLLSVGQSYVTAWVSQHIMADFRTHVFAHLQRLSLRFFAARRTGEILSRVMNDVSVIQSTLTEMPIDSTKQLVTLIGGIAFLLIMNWRLCLLILLLLPALVLVARFFGKRLKALSTTIQDQTAAATTLIEEVVSGIRIVKSFVQTRREEQRFAGQVRTMLQLTLRRARVMAIFIPTITLLTFAAASAVLWYGGTQVIDGSVSPGELFAFVLFAGILIGPFGSAARVFAQIKEAQGAMRRVFDILDTAPDVRDRPDAVDMPSIIGHVTVERVSFPYDARQPVLIDISFDTKPGEVIAFVGPTGSGKTTLVNLLHRFYDPSWARSPSMDMTFRRSARYPCSTGRSR